MSRVITGETIPDMKFAYPFRILLSGSSGAGKTYIAKQILINRHLFQKKTKRVVYFYPCYLDQKPVNWDEDLGIPITYRVGIPSQDDIDVMLPHTTIVLDDTYDEAIQSTAIDHLFRVNSGKKFLNVLIMISNKALDYFLILKTLIFLKLYSKKRTQIKKLSIIITSKML